MKIKLNQKKKAEITFENRQKLTITPRLYLDIDVENFHIYLSKECYRVIVRSVFTDTAYLDTFFISPEKLFKMLDNPKFKTF